MGKRFYDGPAERLTKSEVSEGLEFLSKYIYFIEPSDDDYSLDVILDIAKMLVKRYGIGWLTIY